jgi:catechol 2,3-dioxygenase-like lactoylglutathione lyase family enzyme
MRALQWHAGKRKKGPVTFQQGHKLIKRHTRDLLAAGMNCARINCAQGGPEEWERMRVHLERARKMTGDACRTFMDVAGPKIRTGPLAPGPRILAIRPKKDLRGVVVKAEPVVLVPEGEAPGRAPGTDEGADPIVPITPTLFRALHPGDRLLFEDTRGRPGLLDVVTVGRSEARALSPSTVYLETGLPIALEAGGSAEGDSELLAGVVGTLPSQDDPIVLRPGDTLIIHRDLRPGEPARAASQGRPAAPAHVACTFPRIFDDVRAGESIVLDDGKTVGAHSALTLFSWPDSNHHSRPGAGQTHHIAFRAKDGEEQAAWRDHLLHLGVDVSPVMERSYFRSIYFRAPDGLLLEVATDDPGFAVDEPVASLGSALKLPSWLEPRRSGIEGALVPLR